MTIKTITAAACMALMSAAPGFCASVTLDFPSSGSTLHTGGALGAGGGGQFFQAGHSLTETFSGTGLATAVSSTWDFSMANLINGAATAAFDVLINNVVVDSFLFDANAGSTESFSLSNSFAPIAGEDFTLSIVATSTVILGGGSWNWLPGGSVTLSDTVAAVPVPASLPLLLVAVGGLAAARRRRSAA